MAPSSVTTTSTVTQGPVTLPLFKFSHCTSPSPQAKMIWTHLPQRSDMFAVFDVIRKAGTGMVVSEKQVLKLIRGGELLELVEFPVLQDQVRRDEERALSQPIPDSLLRVLVIVKKPLLALRYMLPDGQIRKMQMNFVPVSGCNVALETFRAAGLPIRDKDLEQIQSQPPQSSQSQPHFQEWPVSLNAHQATHVQSSLGAASDSSQPISLGGRVLPTAEYINTHHHAKQSEVIGRPISTLGGLKLNELNRPISAPSRSNLSSSGSAITVTSVPMIAKPMKSSVLLPSPVFNGNYEPFGSFQIRPMSAPEQTQNQEEDTNTLQVSHMLPPVWPLPLSQTEIHSLEREENTASEGPSKEGPAVPKAKAKRLTKPRAQPAKSRKSRVVEATATPDDGLGLSSSSPHPGATGKPTLSVDLSTARSRSIAPSIGAPRRAASPEIQTTTSLSQPPTSLSFHTRKHTLTDQSGNESNKRQEQAWVETERATLTEPLASNDVASQPLQPQPCHATVPLINIRNPDLLKRIDTLMRNYHDFPAAKSLPRTSKDYLADYAAQSEDDRVRPMNNLISECQKNDDFANLMEDVDVAWKTIGLGFESGLRIE